MRALALAALALGGCFDACDDRPIVDTQTWTFAIEHQGAHAEAEVTTHGKCGQPSPDPGDTPERLAKVGHELGCYNVCNILGEKDQSTGFVARREACEKACAAQGTMIVVGCGTFHGRDPGKLPFRPVIDKLTPEGQRPH